MIHFLATLFSWPNGIVVGNLIASALWAGPALLHLDRRLRRHHQALQAIHDHLDPKGHGKPEAGPWAG